MNIPGLAPTAFPRSTRALVLLLALAPCVATAAPPERPVHRFLDVQIAPDGAHVASIEGDSPPGGYYPEVRDLVIRATGGKSAVTVALPCGRVAQCWPASPAWRSDGRLLAFVLRSPGQHAYSLYTVGADGSGLRQVLSFNGTLTDLSYGPKDVLAVLAIADARKEVGATEAGAAQAGDLDEAPPEQRIALVQGDALRWVSPAQLFVYEYDWLPSGAGFVGTAAPGDGDRNWWTAKLYAFSPTGEPRLLYEPQDRRQQLAEPQVSRDGRVVGFIAGLMSDFGRTGGDVFTVPVAGGPATPLTPTLAGSAVSIGWSCANTLRARVLAGDVEQIVDLGTGQSARAPTLLWSGADTTRAHEPLRRVACPSDTVAQAHETFTVAPEIEIGTARRRHDLTTANTGLTTPMRVSSVRWSNDGFEVQGWLLQPPQVSGKVPLITIVHGGPAGAWTQQFSGPGGQWAMIARGWSVFLPNPRGSYGQGERFTQANVRDFGYGDLRDILTGIDQVERDAPVDDARLGLMGGSYGGFMSMWAVTQTQRFKAAVAAAGISNWQSYYGENGIDEWLLPYFGGTVYDDPQVYARSSAINYIRAVRTPTFVYVGERDIECPAPQTIEFWHALRALGIPTSIMIYPGEGHSLREPAHAEDATRRTIAWFERYLK
jgi:dienelactone hydrolase